VIALFVFIWFSSVSSGKEAIACFNKGKHVESFKEELTALLDRDIHKLLLFIPLAGLLIFTVMPLLYMILMAFTNYDVNHQPPGNLFDWVGLENFKTLLVSSEKLSQTFWPIFGWTLIWAVFATFTNYFGGILLAILINKKGIKLKKVWRTIFVLTIAIPSFVSLLVVRTMLNKNGVINTQLINMGFITSPLPFLTDATWARVTVIVANMWVGIPYTMLIATGILTNIPAELYESARIDGAGPVKMFTKITFPYMWFITTPYLISNFISNVNNFNPIYFLTGGGPLTLDYFKGAGKTDLLVTWLYKLTKDSMDYNYAAAIGIVIFVISASTSIFVYTRSNSFKNEEGLQL
ncbi:MAG: sugar ABC transporter permease, partial [Pseudobutyrivibrio sp.]|nr:sugar ABC transporter permease [Pseudobutyrivibrio sp.]